MKTLKFSIQVGAIDCYIYSGHLFLILKDGELAFSPLSTVIRKLTESYPTYSNLIRLAFQRNDYLGNRQGLMFLEITELKQALTELWHKATEEIHFETQFDSDDYEVIATVPSMPVLDMRLYAMRMYLGTKQGLYEVNLNSDDRYNLKPSQPQRRFDGKVTCLNAKSGEVVISSNSNGLFHGSFLNAKGILKVNEKPVSQKSIRTGWSSYDIINYEEQNNFEYFVNKTENLNQKPTFSKFDESRQGERQRISEFGVSKFGLSALLEKSDILQDEISYCFNSSSSGFFFMKDGRFVNINLNKDKEKEGTDGIYFKARTHLLPNFQDNNHKSVRPISTSIVPKGCVVEYYDKVVLYQNQKAKLIESSPSINVRTYPTSLRYRNIITVTKEDEVSIHSIFPFEENELAELNFDDNEIE